MHGNRLLSKRRLSVLAASAAGALLGSVIVAAPSLAGVAGDQDFTVVGSQSFIVPEDVTVLGIMAVGGGGGAAYFSSQSTYAEGGSGAYVTAVHQVQPGQTITVNVGGGGQASSPGGVNGAGGGGGAASSVFYQDSASDPQRIVAGGGGGGTATTAGYIGGHAAYDGTFAGGTGEGPLGGAGGNATGGGTGGDGTSGGAGFTGGSGGVGGGDGGDGSPNVSSSGDFGAGGGGGGGLGGDGGSDNYPSPGGSSAGTAGGGVYEGGDGSQSGGGGGGWYGAGGGGFGGGGGSGGTYNSLAVSGGGGAGGSTAATVAGQEPEYELAENGGTVAVETANDGGTGAVAIYWGIELEQTIDFPQPEDVPLSNGSATMAATATSELPITYSSSTEDVCTVSEDVVTLLTEGTCTITAAQAGDDFNYVAAEAVTRSFTVLPATPASSPPPSQPPTASPNPTSSVTPTPTPSVTPTPTPSPTTSPTPKPTPVPETTVVFRKKNRQLPTLRRSKLVRKVVSEGRVAKVRATCLYRNQRTLSRKDQRELCAVTVQKTRQNAQVWVTPRCSTNLRARVRVVVKGIPGVGRKVYERTWRVERDTDHACQLSGNG